MNDETEDGYDYDIKESVNKKDKILEELFKEPIPHTEKPWGKLYKISLGQANNDMAKIDYWDDWDPYGEDKDNCIIDSYNEQMEKD